MKKVAYITIKGTRKTIIGWARETGVTEKKIHCRWITMGCPSHPTAEQVEVLFRKPRQSDVARVVRMITLLPDNIQLSCKQITELPECEIVQANVYSRASSRGFVLHRDDLKANRKVVPGPDQIPHIPSGDLAHLSNKKNTGAGKGEIPDEQWISKIGGKAERSASMNTIAF